MEGIGERIALYMKKQSMTDEELARRADIGIMTLRRYIMGYNVPPRADAEKIGAALGVSATYLLGEFDIGTLGEPILNIPIQWEGNKKRNTPETVAVSTKLISEKENIDKIRECFFFIVGDDDMRAAKLTTGDKVLINPAGTVVSGDLVAVRIDGGKTVIRRVFFDGDYIIINKEGLRLERAQYDMRENNVEIVGTVVFAISYPV